MKKLISLLIFVSIFISSYAQKIIWKPIENMPAARRNLSAVSVGNSIFAIGGNGEIKTNYKLDLSSLTWEIMSEKPTGCSNFAIAEVDGKIYAIGGDPFLNKNESYDPTTDTWETKSPMPTARQHVKCGVVDGKIYVIGGLTSWSSISNKVEMYDPQTDSWTEMSPLPVPIQGPSENIVSIDSIIYVVSGMTYQGSDIGKDTKAVQAFNTNTNTWSAKAEMPMKYMGAAFKINKDIFVIGEDGEDEIITYDRDIYRYNSLTDVWDKYGHLPSTLKWQAGIATLGNDSIFMCGGNDDNFTAYSDVLMGVVIHSGNFIPELYRELDDDSCNVGDNYSFKISPYTFIDDDTLTYTAELSDGNDLPDSLTFDAANRKFYGIPEEEGSFEIVVTATDNYLESASDTFNLVIKAAPVSGLKQTSDNSITIYPNPTSGQFTLFFNTSLMRDVELEIYTIHGKLVLSKTIQNYKTESIDLTGYPKGIYMVKLSNVAIWNGKIVIN